MQSRITKWGNSLAVRIPKPIAEAADLHEGDTLQISAKQGKVELKAVEARDKRKRLEALCNAITPENAHGETDWGKPVGNEVW